MNHGEFLAAEFRTAIEMMCPTEQECEEAGGDEQDCFSRHPIHYSFQRDGRIMTVLADLEAGAAAKLMATALRLAGQYIQDFHSDYNAAAKLGELAREMTGEKQERRGGMKVTWVAKPEMRIAHAQVGELSAMMLCGSRLALWLPALEGLKRCGNCARMMKESNMLVED